MVKDDNTTRWFDKKYNDIKNKITGLIPSQKFLLGLGIGAGVVILILGKGVLKWVYTFGINAIIVYGVYLLSKNKVMDKLG